MSQDLIKQYCASSCQVDFSAYSELSNPVYISQVPLGSGLPHNMYPCQCTAYAADRIFQLTGLEIRNVCSAGSWEASLWAQNLSACGYPVYHSVSEAIQANGTLAGLLMNVGPDTCFGGSCNHVAICEGYDPSLNQVYVSEMYGGIGDCIVRLRVYSTNELSQVRWIKFSLEANGSGGGRGGYFKDKFGEFHWEQTPARDVEIPRKAEFQSFCDRLNQAQEEARVENIDTFSATDNASTLTASRFNDMLHLMQTSKEGILKGTPEEEVAHMEDVKKDDLIEAKHFQQLEDLYNHWRYGNNFLVDGNSVPAQIWNFFITKGYSPIVTAGLIGYIGGESNFDPTIEEIGSGIGYGLCQWSFSRRTDLINWCNSHGYDYRTVQGQLEYMYYEIEVKDTTFHYYCNNGCYATVCGGYHTGIGGLTGFKNLSDVYEVVWCFTWWWGRPDASVPRIEERYQIAQTYYTQFYINNPGGGLVTEGPAGEGTFIWPVSYAGITGNYGPRYHPQTGKSEFHMGLDIAATYTPVWACASGTVMTACNQCEDWSYGMSILINHNNGWYTRYAHLSQILVYAGQAVSQGQQIAISGNSGASTGPHLHLELRTGPDMGTGTCVNPINYLTH